MRKNVGVSYYILEYLKELDYGARLTDFYNHFPDTKEQTIRSTLTKLKARGDVIVENGRYYFNDTFDDEIITETLNIESSKFRKKEYISQILTVDSGKYRSVNWSLYQNTIYSRGTKTVKRNEVINWNIK